MDIKLIYKQMLKVFVFFILLMAGGRFSFASLPLVILGIQGHVFVENSCIIGQLTTLKIGILFHGYPFENNDCF